MNQIDEVMYGFRIRTWSERQERGWYLVVGFWWKEFPEPETQEDDRIDVGPFETQEIANAELTGPFRRLINEATKKFVNQAGGFVVDGKAMDRSGWPEA